MDDSSAASVTFSRKPRGLLKIFFKVPIYLHKLGLVGWIEKFSGAQWMLITTIGRKTGKPRQVMVDVLNYDQEHDTYFIEAAYGRRADWVRNIRANPVFQAQVGKREFSARAVELPPERNGDLLVAMYQRAPGYTRAVCAMVGVKVNSEEDIKKVGGKLLLLAVEPIIDND
jgi:deazaflavin-dependent oxidoreductase (nitroreductase family)